MNTLKLHKLGIDIGSTTVKIAILDEQNTLVFSDYERHFANIRETLTDLLHKAYEKLGQIQLCPMITGSGGLTLAKHLDVPFVQEVIAVSTALQDAAPQTDVAIELGGEDAKIIYFEGGNVEQRMNGICAGGTGSFIDQMASLIQTDASGLNEYAKNYKAIYPIAARCGVFAKTDIQPLLIQGADRADIALSTFHAIAKQTIGRLAQGLEITRPVVFEGGPLTFNPVLVQVFAQRLELKEEEVLIPPRPELMVACGAAVSADTMFDGEPCSPAPLLELLRSGQLRTREGGDGPARPFFASEEERAAFAARNKKHTLEWKVPKPGEEVCAYLGIDSGSTTTKFVLMDDREELLGSFYAPNGGEPLNVAKRALIESVKRCGGEI